MLKVLQKAHTKLCKHQNLAIRNMHSCGDVISCKRFHMKNILCVLKVIVKLKGATCLPSTMYPEYRLTHMTAWRAPGGAGDDQLAGGDWLAGPPGEAGRGGALPLRDRFRRGSDGLHPSPPAPSGTRLHVREPYGPMNESTRVGCIH